MGKINHLKIGINCKLKKKSLRYWYSDSFRVGIQDFSMESQLGDSWETFEIRSLSYGWVWRLLDEVKQVLRPKQHPLRNDQIWSLTHANPYFLPHSEDVRIHLSYYRSERHRNNNDLQKFDRKAGGNGRGIKLLCISGKLFPISSRSSPEWSYNNLNVYSAPLVV